VSGGECRQPQAACAFEQAEHPSYTTINVDVALCGNSYTAETIDQACGEGWQVCRIDEWRARYPAGRAPGGTVSTFGQLQSERCPGGVWECQRPESDVPWDSGVCGDSYNPYNNGKFLYGTDLEILAGDGGHSGWDTDFSSTDITASYAGVLLPVAALRRMT
jgi:hypothetical protein